ncbi:MAG: response regulator [Planctomycetota bacterium]|nr:response regulator [Planctomycetota bacterium]
MSAPLVLLADNDRAVSALLTEVLARVGLTVQPVFDGESARLRAREHGVAVLVCDLDMPRLSGLEVIESLADLANPPLVVVVSGYLEGRVRCQLAVLPFVRAILQKPFDLLEFAKKVRILAFGHDVTGAAPSAPPLAGGTER